MVGSPALTLRSDSAGVEPLESRMVCAAAPVITDASYETAWQSAVRVAHEQFQLTGLGQTVAIIDSGIAYDHPAFGNGLGTGFQVVGGWDFTEENDANPYDDGPAGFHGTHVAGILASQDARYPGMAPDVNVVSLRVFNDQGSSDFHWIERALQWVYDHRFDFASPITTVNMSLGVPAREMVAGDAGLLDNELRQLVDAGVFVAVAAGNGFDQDGVAELNYPASSTVPVAVGSTTSSGQLSAFTRREPRMLLAPGENVTSTITDYLYDFNGRTDDFHAFSGTSQATPRVAGAAVLVRQALERAGHEHIDQRLIFDILRQTADPLVNPANGHVYARINLRAALDYVLPDPEPSAADQARDLGILQKVLRHRGSLETVVDRDYFAFTTSQSGTLTWNLQSSGAPVRGRIQLDGAEIDAKTPVWVRAQQRITLVVDGDGIASYEGAIQLEAAHDLGPIVERRWERDADAAEVYQFQASRTGWFSLLAQSKGQEPVRWTLRDAQGRVIFNESLAAGSTVRRDHVVASGETLRLEISGSGNASFQAANLVEFASPGAWRVEVPATVERLAIELRESARLVLGDWDYEISPEQARTIDLTLRGTGSVRLTSSRQDDRIYLRPQHLLAANAKQIVQLNHQRQVEVRGLEHAGQELRIYGDGSNERFESRDGLRIFTGNGARYEANGIDRVYVFGRGGEDSALLHGTAQDDLLVAQESGVRMSVGDRLDYLEGFASVEADGGAAGLDRAILTGSAGNDRFSFRSHEASLITPDQAWYAAAFDKVYASGGAGGLDRAFLHGTSGNDEFLARAAMACLSGSSYTVSTDDFDRVYATGGDGGWDRAKLEGTAGEDVLTLRTDEAALGAGEQIRVATGFDEVTADGLLGNRDRIVGPGDETSAKAIMASSDWIRLAALSYLWQARGFELWKRSNST